MNFVTFDKDKYHLQREMETWCKKYVGEGGWTNGATENWDSMGSKLWTITSMFGRTTFAFKEEKHYTFFILRWGS